MKNALIMLLFLVVIPLGSQEYYPDFNNSWTLVWSDEFQYHGPPDPEKWQIINGQFGWNEDLQYFSPEDNLEVRDGSLFLRTDRDEQGAFRSGGVQSLGRGEWLYGRVVVRARVPSALGLHPAIWMLPAIHRYNDQGPFFSGEIDIMEHVGFEPQTLYSAVQTGARNIALGNGDGGNLQVSNPGDFHIYELNWTEENLEILVDGRRSFRLERGPGNLARWPFIHPYYLILHMSMGGSWAGMEGLAPEELPKEMEIDFVRIYQQLPEASQYSVEVQASPGGRIDSFVPRQIPSGEILEVEGIPREGYEFLRWQGWPWGMENPLSVSVHRDIELTALFQPLGNQLENPHFMWSARGWQVYQGPGCSVESNSTEEGLELNILQGGENPWDSGLYQSGIPLQGGETFIIGIRVQTQEPQSLRISLVQAQEPYGEYWGAPLDLRPGQSHYEIEGRINRSDPNGRILLQLGQGKGRIEVQEFTLVYQ